MSVWRVLFGLCGSLVLAACAAVANQPINLPLADPAMREAAGRPRLPRTTC